LFGHERGNIEAFKALRSAGADVRVAVPTMLNGGEVRRELVQLGFATYPMPFGFQWSKAFFRKNPGLVGVNLWHWVRCQLGFDAAIRDFRPTHVQLGNALAFNFVELAVRRHRLPLVLRLGDTPPVDSAVQMAMWRRYLRGCSRAMAISRYIWDASAAHAPELNRLEPCVIYNLAPTPTEAPKAAEFVAGRRHVVYVGQIIQEKGVFHLLEAAAQLDGRFADVMFHFVGGSMFTQVTEAELRQRAAELGLQDRVVFHGWVGNVSRFLATADVHVAPSICLEALGNVVMEAKREGTPSVVFPSGGLPETVGHHVDGVVCREVTATALAEGLVWILDRLASHPGMRQMVRQSFEARFGEARFRNAWAELYLRT
jgi:glycosyltransferase involved in cell wall biosynthesis